MPSVKKNERAGSRCAPAAPVFAIFLPPDRPSFVDLTPRAMSSPSAGSVSPMAQDAPLPDAPRPPAGAPSESGSSSELDTSFFPAPAHFYKRYTSANLLLPSSHPDVLSLPNDPITFLARDLEPPNPDWVLERGSYSVFGETWPVEEVLPSLSDMGVTEMFTPRAGPLPPSLLRFPFPLLPSR